MELSQAYATRIKQLMKENRVNLYKLSKMSGVPHPTISVLLSCKTKDPRSKTILNICRAFNMNYREFYDSALFDLENISEIKITIAVKKVINMDCPTGYVKQYRHDFFSKNPPYINHKGDFIERYITVLFYIRRSPLKN